MMFLHTLFGIMAIYGLYFYICGIQELPPDIRKSLPPQDIEDFTEEKNQQRYFGQIILMIVAMYIMILLHI